MIRISGSTMDEEKLVSEYGSSSVKKKIINILSSSSKVYDYSSPEMFKFELTLRHNIVQAALELNNSKLSFRIFTRAKCNPDYWHLTNEGGFLLQRNVKPSDAINDIYKNSSLYGTECSTAMVIVYYKALVETYPEELFNKLFSDIYLMNWQHLDSDLGINNYPSASDYLPGDGRYFKNPDVNPATPEWQGENVFLLPNGQYYGHGIGIRSGDEVIKILNRQRKNGATTSAYLLDAVVRPNFKYLARKYYNM